MSDSDNLDSSTASPFGCNKPALDQNFKCGTTNGSAIAKFQPIPEEDTSGEYTVHTKYHHITAMKEYEGKCTEEIRMEDYMENRGVSNTDGATSDAIFHVFNNPITKKNVMSMEIDHNPLPLHTNIPINMSFFINNATFTFNTQK